jgi:hypothetical protein
VYQGIVQPIRAFDVRLRRTRDEDESGVASVQMGDVGDLIGHQRATVASMVGPAEHAGLEECAVDDQLTTTVEQVEQTRFTLRSVELVLLLHRQPRHPPTIRGHRIAGAGQLLLLHEQLLARSLPLAQRNDLRCLHRDFHLPVRTSVRPSFSEMSKLIVVSVHSVLCSVKSK